MKFIKSLLLMLIILVASQGVYAQEFLWDVDFHGFFDNREYKQPYQKAQTFFGSRLTPEVGFCFRNEHSLKGGISWLEEFGAKVDNKLDYLVYYNYDGEKFKTFFGSFHRKNLMQEFPAAMVYDSLQYFNPLIKGALFQYTGKRGYIEAYIDWRSRQTTTEREIFTLASSANVAYKRVNAGYFLTVNHFARMVEATDDQHVMDNIMFNPHIGFDFSGFAFLDKFTIRAGALVSLNRDRGVGDNVWIIPKGFLGEVNMEWKFIGLKNTYYRGDNQMTFYQEFGPTLHCGDPFYQAKEYDRLDASIYFLRKKNIDCYGKLSFHFVGGRVQSSQELTIRVNFGQRINIK